jgi:hypothetical protein
MVSPAAVRRWGATSAGIRAVPAPFGSPTGSPAACHADALCRLSRRAGGIAAADLSAHHRSDDAGRRADGGRHRPGPGAVAGQCRGLSPAPGLPGAGGHRSASVVPDPEPARRPARGPARAPRGRSRRRPAGPGARRAARHRRACIRPVPRAFSWAVDSDLSAHRARRISCARHNSPRRGHCWPRPVMPMACSCAFWCPAAAPACSRPWPWRPPSRAISPGSASTRPSTAMSGTPIWRASMPAWTPTRTWPRWPG